jgi:hypothetical protein
MSFAEAFQGEQSSIGYGQVSVDPNTNIFKAGSRFCEVTPAEASIIGRLILSVVLNPSGCSAKAMANSLDFQTEELFKKTFVDLMVKLDEFDVANDGGTGSIYFEDTIKGHNLFKVEGGRYRLNTELAAMIGEKPKISEQQLLGLKHQI